MGMSRPSSWTQTKKMPRRTCTSGGVFHFRLRKGKNKQMKSYIKTLLKMRFVMNITGQMSETDAGIAAKRFAVLVGIAILILAATPLAYIVLRWG